MLSSLNKDKRSNQTLFLLTAILAGLICASKKILNPIEIPPDIIGITYSRNFDIVETWAFGSLLSFIIASVCFGVLFVIQDKFLAKKTVSEKENVSIESEKNNRLLYIFFALWLIVAVVQVNFTEVYDPVDFTSSSEEFDDYGGDNRDDYFYK